MLDFSIDMFHYHKPDKTFTQEASSLGLPASEWNSGMRIPWEKTINIINNKTGNSEVFQWFDSDMGPENEVTGWNYRSETGLYLLIIND